MIWLIQSKRGKFMLERMKINFGNFMSFYRDYFKGNRSKEDMTLICTQPFWQSLILSKKRLDEKGLTLEFDYADERKTLIYGETHATPTIHVEDVQVSQLVETKTNLSATTSKRLNVTRRIMHGGRELFKDSGETLVNMSQMKEKVDSAYVICPNCGHTGTASSFIAGCDHCNSKFQVYDAEVKVSSFNIEKDYGKKTKRQFKGITKALAKLTAVLGILEVLLFVAMCVADAMNIIIWDEKIGYILLGGFAICMVSLGLLLCAGVVTIATWCLFDGYRFKRVQRNNALDEICKHIPGFFAEAFAQNLEMKLRNIHMTDRADEVNVFSHVDLSEAVERYRNVIDCSLANVKFLDYKEDGFNYQILVNAKMDLLRYDGEKIWEDYESICIVLSGQSGMNEDDIRAVSMYKCDSCGSSVSLLNGGVCAHCGQRLPYEKHSLIIEKYYADMTSKDMNSTSKAVSCGDSKVMSETKKTRMQLLGLFGVLTAVTVGFSLLICEDIILNLMKYL